MRDDSEAAVGENPAGWMRAVAANQDRAAFAALFEFYAPRIKGMLMRLGASNEAAEDLAQETLIAVWRKAAQYDPQRASVAAWIYTIARNLRIDRARHDKRATLFAQYEMIDHEDPERPDGLLDTAEREQRVRAALDELPAEQFRVLQLSFFEGRAHGDIAKLLQLPVGTVKSRIRLAVSRLRQKLGELK